MFHAQVGNRNRTGDALNVASSMFFEGMEKFAAGELTGALALFEQALSINQKYLNPSASGCVLCYNNIAAVHDKLGNLNQAVSYYERARQQLSSKQLPQAERGLISRRKRAELLRHVEQKLDMMPRTPEPKVRASPHLYERPECPAAAVAAHHDTREPTPSLTRLRSAPACRSRRCGSSSPPCVPRARSRSPKPTWQPRGSRLSRCDGPAGDGRKWGRERRCWRERRARGAWRVAVLPHPLRAPSC